MLDLRSLLVSVDDLLVGTVAQELFCAEPAARSPQETYEEARDRGFDHLPIREGDGAIKRVIDTHSLRDAPCWDALATDMRPLSADWLVARDAPVFSLLQRFNDRDVLFALGRDGVDGVVTLYDLNQPAAHLLGFGLALICEAEVARVLREHLGEDPATVKALAEPVIGRKSRSLQRWALTRAQGKDAHLTATLTFGEKLKLLPFYGLEALSARRRVSPDVMLAQLQNIKSLRNAIGHNDADDRLADPDWVHQRMAQANAVARDLAGPRAPT